MNVWVVCACVRCANVENYIQLSNATCRQLWKLCEQVPDSVKTILICNFMRKITYRAREQEKQHRKKEWMLNEKRKKNNIKCFSVGRVGAARSTYKRTFVLLIVAYFSSTIVVYIHSTMHLTRESVGRFLLKRASAFHCFALSLL